MNTAHLAFLVLVLTMNIAMNSCHPHHKNDKDTLGHDEHHDHEGHHDHNEPHEHDMHHDGKHGNYHHDDHLHPLKGKSGDSYIPQSPQDFFFGPPSPRYQAVKDKYGLSEFDNAPIVYRQFQEREYVPH